MYSSPSSSLLVLTGRPAMPIYWALGYHLCRWGYNSSESTWEAVKSMRNYGIPQVRVVYVVRLSVWLVEFFMKLITCVGLLAGRPVERYRLHGTFSGLHVWLRKVRHAAWSGQGPSRTWPALRHDPGTREIMFAFICVLCLMWRVCVTAVSQPAGSRYQQLTAWGLVLAVRRRAEETHFYHWRWRRNTHWEGETGDPVMMKTWLQLPFCPLLSKGNIKGGVV